MKKNREKIKGIIDNVLQVVKNKSLKIDFKNIKLKNFSPSEVKKWDKSKKKKFIIGTGIGLGVIVIAICIGGYIHKINTIKITNNKAEECFYKNKYDDAINEYSKLAKDESWPIWKIKEAEVYSVKSNIVKSNDIIDEVIKDRENYKKKNNGNDIKIKDEELTNYIVFTEFMNKNFNKALKDGEEYLKEYPTNKPLIRTMFTVYMANGQADKAMKLLKEYKVDNTAYDLAVYARMNMLVDNWDEGYKLLEKAYNLDKDEYKVYDVIAQTSAYNRNFVLEKLYVLSQKDDKNIAYKIWIAKIHSMNEESSEEALNILDSLKGKDLGKFATELIRASALKNTGKIKESEELLQSIIEKNKDDYRVYHTAAWYYFNKKDYKKALEYCDKSILKNKEYPDNYGFLMPEIMQATNKSSEAEPYFRTALLKEPFNYNIMIGIANYYWYTTESSDKALEYFGLASLIKPKDAEVVYNMALIKLKENKNDEAVELLKKCISIDEAIPKYHRTLGTIYVQADKKVDGLKEIRAAYAVDKNDILTLNNAGCYYISVEGEVERGMVNLKAAYTGLTDTTDEYTKKTITENYQKAKTLYDEYNKEQGNSIKIPDFTLFY
ncbi:hypothetical protein SAMN02745163_03707 [Clostridium cavendishii DSM 21758]|uniref:Uncharacterized protein n=1 Tax=Clostridium cavendishii DSM 21758 TaxID=1121302 RepID=A0A1M6RYL7_9CLOT|nr:hypothetical protein [Clostridium cavendishii]SHK37642.1 hypothetical protein SAMN02745163_03707 [Clostridium cavendishii DSM 21758]